MKLLFVLVLLAVTMGPTFSAPVTSAPVTDAPVTDTSSTIGTIILTRPDSEFWTQLYTDIDYCYMASSQWNQIVGHFCWYFAATTVAPGIVPANLTDTTLTVARGIYQDYGRLLKMETLTTSECYYNGTTVTGTFAGCVTLIRNRFEGLGFGPSFERIRALWDSYYRSDVVLVYHCYKGHQTVEFDKCKGITFDRKWDLKTDRIDFIKELWNKYHGWMNAEIHDHAVRYEMETVRAKRCIFEALEWVKNPNDICWFITKTKNLTEEAKFGIPNWEFQYNRWYQFYHDIFVENHINDCLDNHKTDKFEQCYGFTWDDDSIASRDEYVPKNSAIRKYWNAVKIERARGDVPVTQMWIKVAAPAVPKVV